jgi:hypothetical protein
MKGTTQPAKGQRSLAAGPNPRLRNWSVVFREATNPPEGEWCGGRWYPRKYRTQINSAGAVKARTDRARRRPPGSPPLQSTTAVPQNHKVRAGTKANPLGPHRGRRANATPAAATVGKLGRRRRRVNRRVPPAMAEGHTIPKTLHHENAAECPQLRQTTGKKASV